MSGVVFITGGVDSGKTSLVRGLALSWAGQGRKVSGVLSPARRVRGRKSLYLVENLRTGFCRPLLERRPGGPRPAAGGFAYGNSVLGRIISGVAIVDEFGPIELSGGGFCSQTRRLSRARDVALLVVVRRGLAPAAAKVLGLKKYSVVDVDVR
jgi:nucleoside-triphosphatase THEP1